MSQLTSARKPKGYQGIDHETVGSDLLAVLSTVVMPENVLGTELLTRLRTVEPSGWYPISWMLQINEALDAKLGRNGLRQMGRQLFRDTHAEAVKRTANSARDIIYGLDGMYHHANRGLGIGGWLVTQFEPGSAKLEKTTPHHCVMEEGILAEALMTVGVPALVRQSACFRTGAESCHYEVSAPVYDARWTGR
jgi:hypothetical protein